jgi:hypothetical protein
MGGECGAEENAPSRAKRNEREVPSIGQAPIPARYSAIAASPDVIHQTAAENLTPERSSSESGLSTYIAHTQYMSRHIHANGRHNEQQSQGANRHPTPPLNHSIYFRARERAPTPGSLVLARPREPKADKILSHAATQQRSHLAQLTACSR